MPGDENSLGFQMVFCFDDVLCKVLSVVRYLSPHVVDHKRLRKVILVVRVRHCLKVQSHHCARLNIAELVATSCGVHVYIEELGSRSSVFGEVRIFTASLPLLIVVDNVVCCWSEKLVYFLVFEHLIKHVNLVYCGFHASVSDAGDKCTKREDEVELPHWSLGEHHP